MVLVRTGRDWKRLERSLNAATLTPRLKTHIEAAQKAVGTLAVNTIKANIKLKRFRKNHPLTIALKTTSSGIGDQPLFETGGLQRNIKFRVADPFEMAVGVFRGARGHAGEDLVNIADILHDGRVLRVTTRMRAWFAAQGFPLRATTKVIVIPPRPFIDRPLRSSGFNRAALRFYSEAANRALVVRS